jgi:hypothetical protein
MDSSLFQYSLHAINSINATNSTTPQLPLITLQIEFGGRLAISAIFLPIQILTLIGLAVFTKWKRQPVYSRLLAPWVGTIYQLFFCIDYIVYYAIKFAGVQSIYVPDYSYGGLYFLSFFNYASYMAFAIQTVRYYLMRGMYKSIAASKKISNIAIYKRLTSRKLYYIVTIVFAIIMYILVALLAALRDSGVLSFSIWSIADNALETPVIVALMATIIISFLVDLFVFNGNLIFKKCGWVRYFITEDPLRFRVEISIIILGAIDAITIACIQSFGNYYSDPVGYGIANVIVYLARYTLWWAAFGGLVCIYSLVDLIQQKRKYNADTEERLDQLSGEQRLYKVIEDVPDGYNLISDYCKVELSSENLVAWDHVKKVIQKWASLNDDEKRHELELIYDMYLDSEAELEINIQNAVRQEFLRAMGKGAETPRRLKRSNDDRSDDQKKLDALVSLNKGIVENISDTFSRLEETRAFKVYWSSLEAKSRIQDKAHLVV